jgi:hypothetical protein
MESSAALAVFVGLGFVSTSGPLLLPEGLMLAAVLIGVAASLVALVYGRRSWHGRVALVAGAALAVIAPAALAASSPGPRSALLLALGVVYWRGIAVVMAEPEAEDIVFRFSMGLGLFLIGCVLATARGMMFEPGVATLLTVAGVIFVLAALSGLAAASLRRSLGGGGVETSVAALGFFIVLVSGLALLSYEVVTSHLGGFFATVLSPVWNAVTHGIALGLTWLLMPLFALIQRTHFRLPRPQFAPTPQLFGRKIPTPMPRVLPHTRISHSTDALLAAVVIGAAVLLLVFLIWRTASSIGGRKRKDREGEREPMEWSPAEIWHGLAAWIRGLFRETVDAAVQTVQRVRTRIIGPSYPSDPVRRIYAQILYRAAINGVARPPAVTPLEFERALSMEWPDGAGDFAAVTAAYVLRRYGEESPEPDEIARLRRHWQHLRTIMRRPRPAT